MNLEENIQRRLILIDELAKNIIEINKILISHISDIENLSHDLFIKLLHENNNAVQADSDTFKLNLNRIRQMNSQSTSEINEFFNFIKDGNEMNKITYPFKFLIKKRNLLIHIKKLNENIASFTMENRFIKEQLSIKKNEYEKGIIKQVNESNKFAAYQQILNKKKRLISDLEYLLATVKHLFPEQIALLDIDNFVKTYINNIL